MNTPGGGSRALHRRWPLVAVAAVFVPLALVAASVGSPRPTRADAGPHVTNYSMTTDACAGCHRAHTAQGEYLLAAANELALCLTCHDGSGAKTNVRDGILLSGTAARDNTTPPGADQLALYSGALRGGGFDYARINTKDATFGGAAKIGVRAGGGEAVTSWHSVDGSPQTAWGNGAIDSGPGLANFELHCTSCHNPHGNGNYRILRPVPTGSGASTGVSIGDEDPKVYSTTDYFYVPLADISGWCALCHTRYLAPLKAATTSSGDSTFRYRHAANDVSYAPVCIKCHVAHGTNAASTGIAATVSRPGDGTDGVGGSDPGSSSLLKMDNRGICQKCHKR